MSTKKSSLSESDVLDGLRKGIIAPASVKEGMWLALSRSAALELSDMRLFTAYLDWHLVLCYHKLSADEMREFESKLDIKDIMTYQTPDQYFIDKAESKYPEIYNTKPHYARGNLLYVNEPTAETIFTVRVLAFIYDSYVVAVKCAATESLEDALKAAKGNKASGDRDILVLSPCNCFATYKKAAEF